MTLVKKHGVLDLELHKNVSRKGVRELTGPLQQALPGHGAMKLEMAQIDQLEKGYPVS